LLTKIIKGCQQRQRDSQKELYEKFYAYGMSITLRYADSRDQGVEILNDSFMKVFENIRKFDSERPFKPWLRRIIINTAIDHYHRNKKVRELSNYEITENSMAEDEKILSGISYEEIIDMMQELSPAYRAVFNLHVIEGFSHEEIAEKLGISVGTSKSNLSKAKKNLRVILEKNLM